MAGISSRQALSACMMPASIFFAAFWLLPIALLVTLPAKQGWETYFVILTDARVQAVTVSVRKMRPPVPQQLDTSGVRIHRER